MELEVAKPSCCLESLLGYLMGCGVHVYADQAVQLRVLLGYCKGMPAGPKGAVQVRGYLDAAEPLQDLLQQHRRVMRVCLGSTSRVSFSSLGVEDLSADLMTGSIAAQAARSERLRPPEVDSRHAQPHRLDCCYKAQLALHSAVGGCGVPWGSFGS